MSSKTHTLFYYPQHRRKPKALNADYGVPYKGGEKVDFLGLYRLVPRSWGNAVDTTDTETVGKTRRLVSTLSQRTTPTETRGGETMPPVPQPPAQLAHVPQLMPTHARVPQQRQTQ